MPENGYAWGGRYFQNSLHVVDITLVLIKYLTHSFTGRDSVSVLIQGRSVLGDKFLEWGESALEKLAHMGELSVLGNGSLVVEDMEEMDRKI